MKILYLLFAVLFLAFLSQPGNAHHLCARRGGTCRQQCRGNEESIGQVDCQLGLQCCVLCKGK